jgi:monoamine oxidase
VRSDEVIRRRDLLSLIGAMAGSAAMYHAMTSLGFASESPYKGPVKLQGDPRGASVLILGAGLAGMTAALELRKAGYKVQVLEFNSRPGGRNWTLRGGDSFTELGGFKQTCEFEKGLYLNPGPWRIPYHHRALLDYCRRLGVALEPFIQLNHNALLHASRAFGGAPQRIRAIKADFQGQVSELLAKVAKQGALDEAVTKEDQEILLQALKSWGALDGDYKYNANLLSAEFRGYMRIPAADFWPIRCRAIPLACPRYCSRRSALFAEFRAIQFPDHDVPASGGMDMIGKAFAKEIDDVIRYNAKVTQIRQTNGGVTVGYVDTANPSVTLRKADWCVCTIRCRSEPDPDRRQPRHAGRDRRRSLCRLGQVGLQFKRRFGKRTRRFTAALPIPICRSARSPIPTAVSIAPAAACCWALSVRGANSYEFTAMTPAERVKSAVEFGAVIHPQYETEFENGVADAWHRVPFTLGCAGEWTDAARAEHYRNLCQIDGRIVLAGEHASDLPAWQEGAILSSLDAIARLHDRVLRS